MLYDKRWEKKETKVDEDRKIAEWQRILLKAAALLRRNGWCQGRFENDSGQLCAYGAINVAAGLEASSQLGEAVVTDAIQHVEKSLGGEWITNWNDNYATSQVEVIDTLKKAAQDAQPVHTYQEWHLWLA